MAAVDARIDVRRGLPTDTNTLGVVGPAAYAEAYAYLWDDPQAFLRQLKTFSADAFAQHLGRENARIWVAVVEGDIVGFLTMNLGVADPVSRALAPGGCARGGGDRGLFLCLAARDGVGGLGAQGLCEVGLRGKGDHSLRRRRQGGVRGNGRDGKADHDPRCLRSEVTTPISAPAPNQAFESPDWRGADLSDHVFDNCAISDGVFADANLTGARFFHCRLVRCAFTHADAREAIFDDCVFTDRSTRNGANFAFARLDEARFRRCDLRHAKFEGADLYAAGFEDCNLLGAQFSRARFHRAFSRKIVRASVAFIACNLDLADLSDANLGECDFSRTRLREADLSGSNLEEANLRDADLFQAIIDNARMAGADLRGAEVSGFDLRRLASYHDLKITADQQYRLLDALGIDVHETNG